MEKAISKIFIIATALILITVIFSACGEDNNSSTMGEKTTEQTTIMEEKNTVSVETTNSNADWTGTFATNEQGNPIIAYQEEAAG